jgi:hypothetical protein
MAQTLLQASLSDGPILKCWKRTKEIFYHYTNTNIVWV